MEHFAGIQQLYLGGDMEAAVPLSGQVVGRIDEVKSAHDILDETVSDFHRIMDDMARQYAGH